MRALTASAASRSWERLLAARVGDSPALYPLRQTNRQAQTLCPGPSPQTGRRALIDRLENAGYVVREGDPADRQAARHLRLQPRRGLDLRVRGLPRKLLSVISE
jgi:hypothetical protein